MHLPTELIKKVGGLKKKVPAWLTGKFLFWGAMTLSGVAILIALSIFDPGETQTTSTKKDSQGKILETTTTTTPQDAKNVWDWVDLLGVPIGLALFGVIQQSRADQQAKTEKDIAESDHREEALQNYLDRLSDLLIDKNVIALATKVHRETGEQELLAAASDVIRARTLSILRRLGDDRERKGHILTFLIETEVISKLKLDLRGINIREIDLSGANLSGANLSGADLRGINFSGSDLSSADLSSADLSGANFSVADLSGTNLSGSDLSYADFSYAKLIDANLLKAKSLRPRFVSANLNGANLRLIKFSGADFIGADFIGANLTEAKLCSSDLTGSDLSGSDLSDASLSYSEFCGANLDGAKLNGTNLNGTKLSGADKWSEDELGKAKLFETELPEGCNLNPNRDFRFYEQ